MTRKLRASTPTPPPPPAPVHAARVDPAVMAAARDLAAARAAGGTGQRIIIESPRSVRVVNQ